MIDSTNITSKGLEKAQIKYEQAKQKLADEMAKAKEEKRKAETHHKCVMGGLVAKYFQECYQFEESELNNIIRAAMQSADCRNAIMKIKNECAKNGSVTKADESQAEQQNERQ